VVPKGHGGKVKDVKSQETEAQALNWDYLQRGYCYCQMKEYERGISDFSYAIRLDSSSDQVRGKPRTSGRGR